MPFFVVVDISTSYQYTKLNGCDHFVLQVTALAARKKGKQRNLREYNDDER